LILTAAGWLGAPVLAADLETGFVHPPASARPWVWYRVCGYFSKAGITADLESLAKQGFGGLTVDISDGGPLVSANIKSNMAFLSPEFSDHLFFILEEAKRLGLEVPIMPLNGWSAAGGNWIKPEHREHVLAWDEVVVTGPGQQKISLQPPLSEGAFFKDIVTLAIPIERLPTESSFRKAKPKVRADTVKPGTPEGNWNASADMVIDGNPGSFITLEKNARGKKPAITLTFDKPFTAESLYVHPGGSYVRTFSNTRFSVQVSDDGETFREVHSFDTKKVFKGRSGAVGIRAARV